MMIRVEFRIGIRTSFEALNTTSITGSRLSGGRARFSRRCFQTFSTSTIASSTREPMAMAIPPRLMVLRLSPRASSTRIVTSSDRGRVMSEIIVVRTLAKKTKRTMTTKMAPS